MSKKQFGKIMKKLNQLEKAIKELNDKIITVRYTSPYYTTQIVIPSNETKPQ